MAVFQIDLQNAKSRRGEREGGRGEYEREREEREREEERKEGRKRGKKERERKKEKERKAITLSVVFVSYLEKSVLLSHCFYSTLYKPL